MALVKCCLLIHASCSLMHQYLILILNDIFIFLEFNGAGDFTFNVFFF